MRERWPHWVYRDGKEPDYRFSFANERTFLAWIRTALALLAGASPWTRSTWACHLTAAVVLAAVGILVVWTLQ